MSTTPTEIAIYHNRMMPFYFMVAASVCVIIAGITFFNWNIASQVRELRDETNARLSDLERRVLQQQSSEEQRIVEAIKARADVANAMREDQ